MKYTIAQLRKAKQDKIKAEKARAKTAVDAVLDRLHDRPLEPCQIDDGFVADELASSGFVVTKLTEGLWRVDVPAGDDQ